MENKRPKTKDEIERDEALKKALQKWFNGTTMDTLDEYHQKTFGHSFSLEKGAENDKEKSIETDDLDR